MIQYELIHQANALVIQGVAFDLPLKFLWTDRETLAEALERAVRGAKLTSWIFTQLHGRN